MYLSEIPNFSEGSGLSVAEAPSDELEIKVSSCRITFRTLPKYCRDMVMLTYFYKVVRILAKEEKKREALKLGDWPKVCDYAI